MFNSKGQNSTSFHFVIIFIIETAFLCLDTKILEIILIRVLITNYRIAESVFSYWHVLSNVGTNIVQNDLHHMVYQNIATLVRNPKGEFSGVGIIFSLCL